MKSFAVAALLSFAAVSPALAGPPWISIEFRPHGISYLVVHTSHHGTANPMALRGTAEGLLAGRRVSVPLRFDANPAGSSNYDVVRTWGEQGVWVLSIATADDSHMGAGAVVLIDRTGTASVRFPRKFDGQSRAATPAEIEATLRALEAGETPRQYGRTGWMLLASRMLLPLVLIGALILISARIAARVVTRIRARNADARRATHAAAVPTATP